jgi:hypothetical protein
MNSRPDAEFMWADTTEDLGIKKFKEHTMDSGRSPYVRIALQIVRQPWTKEFSWNKVYKSLMDEFADAFPPNIAGGFEQAQLKIVRDLKELTWLSGTGTILSSWSHMASSSELLDYEYTGEQSDWIKKALLQQAMVGSLADLADFKIQFAGYGTYVDRSESGKRYYNLNYYSRFKQADKCMG